MQSAPSRRAVVKCVAKGVTTYATSVADCPARAEVTSVAIDPELNITEGIRDAPSILRAQSAVTQAPAIPSGTATDPNWDRKAVCAAYEEEIKAIDERARQPLSAWEQDYLAAKRKKARDQQFRLGC